MEELKKLSIKLLKNQHFDTLAVGVIDFSSHEFESFEIHEKSNLIQNDEEAYFF